MRAATRHLAITSLLAGGLVIVPLSRARAQDDEFDDEFDDEVGADESSDLADAEDEFNDDFSSDAGDGEDGDGVDDESAADAEAPPADEERAAQRFRAQNTLFGPTGGLRLVDALGAAPGSFRLQLATEFFFTSDFLNTGDSNDHIGGHLSLSWAVHDFVELNASISSYANSNTNPDPALEEDPTLFQVLGDTTLGVKVGANVTPFLSMGADLQLALLNTVGDIGLVLASTSLGIRGNMTADLRGLRSPVPFIARFNVGYFLDNSGQLIEGVENARYAALPDPSSRRDEDRHLLSRVERYSLQIDRTDFFTLGLGIELPLRAADDFYIQPLLEWNWRIPVNRQGYNCLFIPSTEGGSEPPPGVDGCLDKQGVGAFPMILTLGARVLPPVQGLAGFLSVDIGLTGTSTFVRELSPTAPYTVMLGLSYAYDTTPPPVPEPIVREVERRVEVRVPPPPKGRVLGHVVEQGAGTPVAGAIVRFQGQDLTALVADDQGRFTSYQLDPGPVTIELTHPEYNPGGCAAVIADEGGDVEVQCELVALPRVGSVRGRVTGDAGVAVSAEVVITGGVSRTVRSDAAGNFNVQDLPPGSYTARVQADDYLIKQQSFEVVVRQEADVTIGLVPRPRRPLVRVRRRTIQIRRQINFATDSDEILPSSFGLMEEIADVVIRASELTKIEVQGHTDNRGRAEHNMDLSQRRAESVRRWLVDHGVAPERLDARGYGMTHPLVPNITPANRARNRRVQFVIKERASQ